MSMLYEYLLAGRYSIPAAGPAVDPSSRMLKRIPFVVVNISGCYIE